MKTEQDPPQAPTTTFSAAQWGPPSQIPIDPALQQQSQHPTTAYSHYQYQHYPQASYGHYQQYGPPQPQPQTVQPAQSQSQSQSQTQSQTQSQSQSQSQMTSLSRQPTQASIDTADIATLNDALGSAGVDLRAEEESLQRSYDQYQSYRPYEDRTHKQPATPNFDTRYLGTTMRAIGTQHKIGKIPEDTVNYLALALRARLQDLITAMIAASEHRLDTQFDRPASQYDDGNPMWSIVIRSDVGRQLAALEKVEREEEMRIRRERKERAEAAAAHTAALAAQAGAVSAEGSGYDDEGCAQEDVERGGEPGGGAGHGQVRMDVRCERICGAREAEARGGAPGGRATTPATTTAPAASASASSGWARPYVPTKLSQQKEEDTRRAVTMRDATSTPSSSLFIMSTRRLLSLLATRRHALTIPYRSSAPRHARLVVPCRRLATTHAGSESSAHDFEFGYYDVILPKEPFVWGTSHITPRTVPEHIPRPSYVLASGSSDNPVLRRRKIAPGEDEARLRRAAAFASEVLQYAGSLVQVGVTTEAIDAKVHEMIVARSAYPSPLLYKGYPKSCCTSINNVITHGIPDELSPIRPLQDGDIVNIDITIFLDGFHGDNSRTFLVGDVDTKGRELVQITENALEAGIAACGPGHPFRFIGKAIHELIHGWGFSISPQFTGHGIGEDFHRPPWILHHRNDEPGVMMPGDCFTIEPCIVQGSNPIGWIFPDGWTSSTEDCARSAQVEHMVLITNMGAEVLTRR
ncbi:Methionine aminopeptidase 1B, chloroplastic [Grifola frondosa]|uniref:Methionine aminopeptidase n=1 Tax=Grifola frondosa TaxID=5627 RepID=A0A1C7M072_GRIFR|nr:Methionine aminopeptidase 1B, chloroplastic [Grifola frondosa]